MSAEALTRDLDRIRADLVELERLLPAAWELQWTPAPHRPAPRYDTEERGAGGPPSDPTADVVLDERRLRVRAAVQFAEALVRRIGAATTSARAGLESAIDAWEGVDDDVRRSR